MVNILLCIHIYVYVHLVGVFEQLTTRMHVSENLKNAVNFSRRHIGEPHISYLKVLVFYIGMADEKLKKYKPTDIVQVSADLIQAGCRQYVLMYLNLLILFGISKNCLNSGRSQCTFL